MNTATHQDITHRFAYHPPSTPEIAKRHEAVRDILRKAALDLVGMVQLPYGRETSLALTHLEEAMFWANAAIARIDNYIETVCPHCGTTSRAPGGHQCPPYEDGDGSAIGTADG